MKSFAYEALSVAHTARRKVPVSASEEVKVGLQSGAPDIGGFLNLFKAKHFLAFF